MSKNAPHNTDGPPPLAIASVIIWYLLSGLSTLITLLLLLAGVAGERPLLLLYTTAVAITCAVEARWVWKGRRSDLRISALMSGILAALWWMLGTGEVTWFAYVPPALMVAAGAGALGARRDYRAWVSLPPEGSDVEPQV